MGGWTVAKTTASVIFPLDPKVTSISITGRCGRVGGNVAWALRDTTGNSGSYSVQAGDTKLYQGDSFADSNLMLRWPGGLTPFFVRPNPDMYNPTRLAELKKQWETLPAASGHDWTIQVKRQSTRDELWCDGQFVQAMAPSPGWNQLVIRLLPDAALKQVKTEMLPPETPILALPVAEFAEPGRWGDAGFKLEPKAILPPEMAVPKAGSAIELAGLGRLKEARGDDLVSSRWKRNALQALPEARLFSVPIASYSHLNVLCAAAVDPAKVPAFTVRVTRYGSGRGDAMADTPVKLPAGNEKPGAETIRVGEVSYGPQAARQTVPLWLVRVPLRMGAIQDLLSGIKDPNPLLRSQKYLDVELLDPMDNVDADWSFPPVLGVTNRDFIPSGPQSSVAVFGATLEEGPASLEVETNKPVLAFYAADAAEWRAKVKARVPGDYQVRWQFADIDGKVVVEGQKVLGLTKAGSEQTVTVPVPEVKGWFATRFQLNALKGEELVEYRGAYVMLAPDTRKAGFESPHGTGWFNWAHGGEPVIERVGQLLQRAGIRHTNLPDSLPEAVSKQYGFTQNNIRWRMSKKPTVAEQVADHEELIRHTVELWPGVENMLIWHESSPYAPYPTELLGTPTPPLSEAQEKAWRERIEFLVPMAKMVREKFPKVKMQYGNAGDSLAIINELLRRKFPKEYIDSFATEDLGQTIIPERFSTGAVQSTWFLRDEARRQGYGDVPMTATSEWMGRNSTTNGLAGEAELYIRDAMHALAYGFSTINLGTIHDAGNGYFFTPWGAGGLTRRYPVMEPKPAYAAVATMTQVLDRAKFVRDVPTGMLSLYVLEFKRGDDWVYPVWTPKVEHEVGFSFPAGTKTSVVDLYGRDQALATDGKIVLKSAVQYIVASRQLGGVNAGKLLTTPPPANAVLVDAMDNAANWEIQDDKGRWGQGTRIPHAIKGDFDLREVVDEQMGKCLEVSLKPNQEPYSGKEEYAVLMLKKDPGLTAGAENAGVWVKGNGGSGDVCFFLKSGKTPFLSQNVRISWTGQYAVNYDGWHFYQQSMRDDPRWKDGGTVTGLLIKLPRHALHLTECQPVPNLSLRLKGVSVF